MVKIIRRHSYRATPWKNGGGITHEVLRVPDGEAFDWRASVAQIERAGPFSDFPAYVRHMALLEGEGVRLRFDHRERTLSQVGELIEFDGAAALHCDLLGGPCTDLNLMVAKHLSAEVTVVQLRAALKIAVLPGTSRFLFNVGAPVRFMGGGEGASLGTWDAVVMEGCEGEVAAAADGAPSALFFATIWHGRHP